MSDKIGNILNMLKEDKKSAALVAAALAVLALFIAAPSFFNSREDTGGEQTTERVLAADAQSDIESSLAELVSGVRGAGRCSVGVTLDSLGELVYARNNKSDKSDEIVIFDSSTGDEPLLITQKSPVVTGVAVLCEGGADASVCEEIKKLVSGLYGLGADRIYVGALSD